MSEDGPRLLALMMGTDLSPVIGCGGFVIGRWSLCNRVRAGIDRARGNAAHGRTLATVDDAWFERNAPALKRFAQADSRIAFLAGQRRGKR